MMTQTWIVVATLLDGGVAETEVFGPFTDGDTAHAWSEQFEDWLTVNATPGGRTIDNLLVTRIADPWFVTTDPLPELVTRSAGEDE